MKSPTTQHKFKRASTTVDRRRQRHPLRRKLSHQQSLPSIGEEDTKGKSEPGDVEVERKGKMRFDSRPNFLKFSSPPPEEARGKRTAVVLKGENLKKKPSQHVPSEDSITKLSSLSDRTTSRQPASQSVHHQKKLPLRKHTNPAALSPLNSPPAETSLRLKRRPRKTPKSQLTDKSVRNPPLSQLKNDSKFTSSEFQADVEDCDDQTPQPTENVVALGGGTRDIDGCVTAVNEAALKGELDSTMHPLQSVTVEAEVHFNPQVHDRSGNISHEKEPSVSSLAHSPSLIPPPPTSRPSSRSGSRLSSHSGSPHPSYHSPSPHPTPPPSPPSTHSPPSFPDPAPTRDSYHSQDLDDFLIPRSRTYSSPSREESPVHDSDTETDTDILIPRTQSSVSGAPSQKALSPSSPTSQKKRLSFERRQGSNSKSSSTGTILLNMPGLGRESDCWTCVCWTYYVISIDLDLIPV